MTSLTLVRNTPPPSCPLCHTAQSWPTDDSTDIAAGWLCGRCGQHWDATRLAAVAVYDAWVAAHRAPAVE